VADGATPVVDGAPPVGLGTIDAGAGIAAGLEVQAKRMRATLIGPMSCSRRGTPIDRITTKMLPRV
jgi:hypothetical protein